MSVLDGSPLAVLPDWPLAKMTSPLLNVIPCGNSKRLLLPDPHTDPSHHSKKSGKVVPTVTAVPPATS